MGQTEFDVSIQPPDLVVELTLPPTGITMELSYDLKEVLDFEGEDAEEITIVDSHWHGIVVENPDGETHHVDLRELDEIPTEDGDDA